MWADVLSITKEDISRSNVAKLSSRPQSVFYFYFYQLDYYFKLRLFSFQLQIGT
jgi:hypothetical protein